MSIEALIEISRYYGSKPGYVLAGGGNTSWKDGQTLYVKGSGFSLAGVTADSFVKMDRNVLAGIWDKHYPESSAERESAVLADMMAAKMPGEENKRPSVEALLHDIMPFALVVHLHPALVNGLTCSRQGETAMKDIFKNDAVWIPSTNPGYVLAQTVKTALETYSAVHGKAPPIIFLQNHGVFAGGNCGNCIKAIYNEIMEKIGQRIHRQPDFSDVKRYTGDVSPPMAGIIQTLSELAAGYAIGMQGAEIAALVKSRDTFAPAASALSPDHIVYAGSDPLFIEDPAALREAWDRHVQATGRNPKIAAVQGLGIFGVAATEKAAGLALDIFMDAAEVLVYTEAFGGPLYMDRDKIDFINNWEVENYRIKVSAQ